MCTGPIYVCGTCHSHFAVDRQRCTDPYSDFHRHNGNAIRVPVNFCDWCETLAHRINGIETEAMNLSPAPAPQQEQAPVLAPRPQIIEPERELQRVETFTAWVRRRQTYRRMFNDVTTPREALLRDIDYYTVEVINHLPPTSYEAIDWRAKLTLMNRAADRLFNFIPEGRDLLSFHQFRRGVEPGMIYRWGFDESLRRYGEYLQPVTLHPGLMNAWREDVDWWTMVARGML